MPIINAEIAETINITGNGQYDVAKYTTANVKTPVARYYVENGIAHKSEELSGDEFSAITGIDDYALNYAFSRSVFSGTVDLSNVQTVGENGLSYAFEYSKVTGFKLSGRIIGKNAAYMAFDGDADLEFTDFSGLTEISGDYAFQRAFSSTGVKNVIFYDLTTITGKDAFYSGFRDSTLKFLAFPALTTVSNDCFTYMLQNVGGCNVVFPAGLESTITSFSSYNSGFGGTDTTVIFSDTKMLPVSIPDGWTVTSMLSGQLTNGINNIFLVGDNYLVATDGYNHYALINFVVTNETTEFVLDPSAITFYTLTLQSNVEGTTYSCNWITAQTESSRTFYLDNIALQPVMYFTSGFTINISALKDGYMSMDRQVDTVDNLVIEFDMAQPTVITYSGSDLLNSIAITEGYEDKYSVDENTGQLVVHTVDNAVQQFSGGLTLPSGTQKVRITGSALVSSEKNYDFGYICFSENEQPVYTYLQIKNNNADTVIFKQSGTDNTVELFDKSYTINSGFNGIITIGWAQDKTIKGDNTMWVDPITIQYI